MKQEIHNFRENEFSSVKSEEYDIDEIRDPSNLLDFEEINN